MAQLDHIIWKYSMNLPAAAAVAFALEAFVGRFGVVRVVVFIAGFEENIRPTRKCISMCTMQIIVNHSPLRLPNILMNGLPLRSAANVSNSDAAALGSKKSGVAAAVSIASLNISRN